MVELKRHLRFLREHRKLLKLRVNATEDLLLNGVREPEHRGRCLHLLSKVDHSAVVAACARLGEGAARSRLLAGLVRFSTDPGILLLFLESLSDPASRRAAAGAFSKVVGRLDFAAMSEARMSRLLEQIAAIFIEDHERAQVLFGLLHSPSFRSSFAEALPRLSAALSPGFSALSAAWEVVIAGQPTAGRDGLVRQGVVTLLAAPEAQLLAYPEEIRLRLLKVSLELVGELDDAERAAAALLESLPKDSSAYRDYALARVRVLLRQQIDVRARWQLKQLKTAQPNCQDALELLSALDGKRLGRIALGWPRRSNKASGRPSGQARRGGLEPGFWLDHQCRVWLRRGVPEEKSRFEQEWRALADVLLPGLATPLIQGCAEGGVPFFLVAALSNMEEQVLDGQERPLAVDLSLAAQGLAVIAALHRGGLTLPDARRHRFLCSSERHPRLRLADFSGLQPANAADCEVRLRLLAKRWCRDLLGAHSEQLSSDLRSLLQNNHVAAAQWARALAVE
ncbi:MAG: hypothetical protein CMP23_15910 [Rickettsiales bacterium]|nr:hypothetical protein [Rickettsiales bacterium]